MILIGGYGSKKQNITIFIATLLDSWKNSIENIEIVSNIVSVYI